MTLTHQDGLSVLRLDNGRANAIDADLLSEVEADLTACRASDAAALVVTGYDRFFSAGLDLVTLSRLDREAMSAFMATFERVMGTLFAWPQPVVAAVNGHAVAGGCVLALQADWRVMAEGKARFGLNEVQLGVGLPPSVLAALSVVAPPASVRRCALEGELFTPKAALDLGLVEELAPPDEVLDRALVKASALAAVPSAAFAQVKRSLRREGHALLAATTPADHEAWLDTWFSPAARDRIAAAVAALTERT